VTDARLVRILSPWERRHPVLFARMRVFGGFCLLILAGILLGYDVWWGVLLVPVAALLFYTAYRLPRAIRATNSTCAK
jgi:hypothetical protein